MLILLAGCSQSPQPRLTYPADLLVKCNQLAVLKPTSYDDVVDYIGYSVEKYDDCAIRHNALVDIIEKDKAQSK